MAGSGRSRANENRRIRQEAMREQLSAKGLIQQVLESAKKLHDLTQVLDAIEVQRLRAAIDARLRLVSKYLPDLKSTELTHELGDSTREYTRSEVAARLLSVLDGARRENPTDPENTRH